MNTKSFANDKLCENNGDYSYICGLNSPEDLLPIPDSKWIISSGFAGSTALFIIDAKSKIAQAFYPAQYPLAKQNMALYGACPGSPNPNGFTGHGLNIRKVSNDLSMLYVVGHGEREAIEVFEVNTSDNMPEITWVGCVLTPEGLEANSVASLKDGTLLATIPLIGFTINDLFKGLPSGAVYSWSPGDVGFEVIKGSEISYANGIEISKDGAEFYVVSSGEMKVMAFSNTNPTEILRTSATLPFIPDNIRKTSAGKLITAGMNIDDPVCGRVPLDAEFDFGKLATCPRSFTAIAVDPNSMEVTSLASSAAQQQFSNVTMAMEINDELWFGSFSGDRIAYIKIAK